MLMVLKYESMNNGFVFGDASWIVLFSDGDGMQTWSVAAGACSSFKAQSVRTHSKWLRQSVVVESDASILPE